MNHVLGRSVYTRGGEKIGVIQDIIGRVENPYIIVKLSKPSKFKLNSMIYLNGGKSKNGLCSKTEKGGKRRGEGKRYGGRKR